MISKKTIAIITAISLIVGIIVGIKQLFFPNEEKSIENNIGINNGVNVQGNGNTINYNIPSSQLTNTMLIQSSNVRPNNEKLYIPKAKSAGDTLNNLRISVMPFECLSNFNEYSWLSKGIAESLINSFLTTTKYDVIEGTQRDKILNEIDFQQGKYVDEKSAVKIGKILGVDRVIIGSYQIDQGSILILSRIVDVETGKIVRNSVIEHVGILSNVFQAEKELSIKLINHLKTE